MKPAAVASPPDARLERFRQATEDQQACSRKVESLAAERAHLIAELRSDGWTLVRLADELGISKQAVASLASRGA